MKSMIVTLFVLALAGTASPVPAEDNAPAKTEAPKKAKKKTKTKAKAATKDVTAAVKAKKVVRDDGLVIEDVKIGTGMEARVGSRVKVHYRGTLMSGKEFDSNMTASAAEIEPFTLDKDHLIAGWVEGIPGMKVGGVRKLKIPYKLAYGEHGTPGGPIPPKADLNFEVELLGVQ
jgi:FKBP-type peptidyl-prolyl cis-trans isomerase